ncbi:unnamed protein product, partial [Symbiodinium sp. CCMP2456]
AALQSRLDKLKQEYTESIGEMKRLNKEEEEQQRKMADFTVRTAAPAPLPDELLEALKHAGVSEEHVQATRAHLAKAPKPEAANPSQLGLTAPDSQAERETKSGKGDRRSEERSRSPPKDTPTE